MQTETASPESNSTLPVNERHNGNVARLPKALRDKVNGMIQEGYTYAAIIESLGDAGKGLIPSNLSRWKERGYQDWLLQQTWLAQTRLRQEPALDLSSDYDATQLNHAALQLGTLHMFEALRDLNAPATLPPTGNNVTPATDPAEELAHSNGVASSDQTSSAGIGNSASSTEDPAAEIQNSKFKTQNSKKSLLDLRLGGDSAAFVRLMNALARASRETMFVQKYRDACVQARAELQPLKDPKRKLNDDERRAIVRKVDEILGLPSEAYSSDNPATNGAAKEGLTPRGGVPDLQVGLAPCTPPEAPSITNLIENEPSKLTNIATSQASPIKINQGDPVSSATEPALAPTVELSKCKTLHLFPSLATAEFCPRCHSLLPPRLASGERYSLHCQQYGCGSPVRPSKAPFEHCPHCGVTVPDLLPNGERAAPTCHECKKPLPPPDQVPELAEYLSSLTISP